MPAWLRYTSAEATEALLASAKLKPAEAAQLRAAEAARAHGQGGVVAVKREAPSVTGPSKARRKTRPTVSFQVACPAAVPCQRPLTLSCELRRWAVAHDGTPAARLCPGLQRVQALHAAKPLS